MSDAADFELLLRQALTPVDPPADMSERIEGTLVNLTEIAADELEAWELSAMRDPRNWASPAAARGRTACSTRPSRRSRTSTARRASSSRRADRLIRPHPAAVMSGGMSRARASGPAGDSGLRRLADEDLIQLSS